MSEHKEWVTEPVVQVAKHIACYHCGQACKDELLHKDGKDFCCYGCQTVYDILNDNDLCEYYSYEANPGKAAEKFSADTFAYLDEKSIRDKILQFQSPHFAKVELYVPAIHCISCLWLLENLQKLRKGVLRSQVNFARKVVTIEYDPALTTLPGIAKTMASVGYPPVITLDEKMEKKNSHLLIAKLSVAGFCFGNIMLLSFPEYLGLSASENDLRQLFSYLNIALSIPVLVFSAQDYFRNTWTSIRQRQMNIDVPIAMGLAALFFRSTYDVLLQIGPGYFDSFSGLVFFLLIGRWFQDKTYENLAFDRDYTSYFPLAIHKKIEEDWKPVVVYELEKGDYIKVRNLEIVPADALLLSDHTFIDYSFVTGESKPVKVRSGELVYAGGRILGEPVELQVQKKTSQSHLTSLWNSAVFQKQKESSYKRIIDKAARGFTWFVLAFAVGTTLYWYQVDPSNVWLILTSVLIVACPCALALAAPFTYGAMLRVFGRHGFYLKNADVIERMASVDAVVFDKTGTLTQGASTVVFTGIANAKEMACIKSLASCSTHPLSEMIVKSISSRNNYQVKHLIERMGKGIEGEIEGMNVKMGSSYYLNEQAPDDQTSSYVFVSINEVNRGYFTITTQMRSGIKNVLYRLAHLPLALLSGDNESDRSRMQGIFPQEAVLKFNQSPHDKMAYIQTLNDSGKHVMMLGDGLNDAGALKLSEVGIAVSDQTGIFTPACDGILQGEQVLKLDIFLRLAKKSTVILKIAFAISFCYNLVALSVAVTGYLTPLVAAILMPISSISVVGFSSLAVNLAAHATFKKEQ